MTRKLRPLEIPVTSDLADSIFGLAVVQPDGSYTTVGKLVGGALEALRQANAVLEANELVAVTARSLMKEQKRRGTPSLRVSSEGKVVLCVQYDGGDPTTSLPRGALGGAGLPSLSSLRAQAQARGIDISDLGRQKRRIMERLENCDPPEKGEVVGEGPPHRLRDEVQTRPLGKVKLPPTR